MKAIAIDFTADDNCLIFDDKINNQIAINSLYEVIDNDSQLRAMTGDDQLIDQLQDKIKEVLYALKAE